MHKMLCLREGMPHRSTLVLHAVCPATGKELLQAQGKQVYDLTQIRVNFQKVSPAGVEDRQVLLSVYLYLS
jgi:hypothetical protein